MKRKDLLAKAAAVTQGERQTNYGNPEDNFKRIADYWTLYLKRHITSTDVAKMMILMKLARLDTNPKHDDSWLDIAGYAACGSEIND